MSDLNVCVFVGRLTRDPETRPVGETTVAKFGLAVGESKKNKTTGEYENEAMFLDCEGWGGTATFLQNNFKKGDPISVSGRLKLDMWETDGQKRSKHTLRLSDVNFVPKNGGGGSIPNEVIAGPTGNSSTPRRRGRPAKTTTTTPVDNNVPTGEVGVSPENDVPF